MGPRSKNASVKSRKVGIPLLRILNSSVNLDASSAIRSRSWNPGVGFVDIHLRLVDSIR